MAWDRQIRVDDDSTGLVICLSPSADCENGLAHEQSSELAPSLVSPNWYLFRFPTPKSPQIRQLWPEHFMLPNWLDVAPQARSSLAGRPIGSFGNFDSTGRGRQGRGGIGKCFPELDRFVSRRARHKNQFLRMGEDQLCR